MQVEGNRRGHWSNLNRSHWWFYSLQSIDVRPGMPFSTRSTPCASTSSSTVWDCSLSSCLPKLSALLALRNLAVPEFRNIHAICQQSMVSDSTRVRDVCPLLATLTAYCSAKRLNLFDHKGHTCITA